MKLIRLSFATLMIVAGGCSPLTLKPADFSWPVESKLTVEPTGMVKDDRYNISFNVKRLLYTETKDTTNLSGRTLWIIRDEKGFYFVTGEDFKNIYVFEQGSGALKLKKKIAVSKTGLQSPAFNQREPYIELLNGDERPVMLTEDGIRKEAQK